MRGWDGDIFQALRLFLLNDELRETSGICFVEII